MKKRDAMIVPISGVRQHFVARRSHDCVSRAGIFGFVISVLCADRLDVAKSSDVGPPYGKFAWRVGVEFWYAGKPGRLAGARAPSPPGAAGGSAGETRNDLRVHSYPSCRHAPVICQSAARTCLK